MPFIFTKKEIALLKQIEEENDEELLSWKLPNLIFPLFVIGLSLLSYLVFKEETQKSYVGFFNLLLNGSLPMFALSRMSSIGVNLFRFDKSKEKKASHNTYNLRIKIDDFSKYLTIIISFYYIYQVIKSPFVISYWYILFIALSTLFIYLSLFLSKSSFLLQERLIERTLGDSIRDEATETKNHLAKKYGGSND